jgi:RNA 2',3'-cyclic 3'-phosphodiesterase
MRLFVAVAVPDRVTSELEATVAPLRSAWPSLRWTGRDAWHLTLAFLGEVNEAVTAKLMPRMEHAASRHSRLALSLAGSGAFPGAGRAHVLWTGVRGERLGLTALARSVAAGAGRAGVPPADGRRGFQPHLTLARSRAAVDVRPLVVELSDFAGEAWTAEEIYLIRSRPDSRPRYETLGAWPLRPPRPPRRASAPPRANEP